MTTKSNERLIDSAGGHDGLRRVLKTFYDAVFDDLMIGFYFARSNKEQLIEREVEMTARALGDTEIRYRGRPLRAAHAPHRIVGGHFDRRSVLLRKALEHHDLPDTVKRAWLEHNDRLRPLITADELGGCDHDAAARYANSLSMSEAHDGE